MSQDWFRAYPGSWDADTLHLTPYQDGLYWRLVRWYMMHRRPPPDNDQALANICRIGLPDWLENASLMRQFFVSKNGLLLHKRCNRELDWQDKVTKTRSDTAKKAADIRWGKSKDLDADASTEHAGSNAPAPALHARGEERRREEKKKELNTEAASSTIFAREDAASFEGKMSGPGHHASYQGAVAFIEVTIFQPAGIQILVWRELNDWLNSGCTMGDITDTITQLIGRARIKDPTWVPKGLGYFSAAILQAKLMRVAPPPPRTNGRSDIPLTITEKTAFRKTLPPEIARMSFTAGRFQEALLAAGLQHRWKLD